MSAPKKIVISQHEYLQKRYDITKDLVSSVMTREYLEELDEPKRRVSLIYNCLLVADTMLKELGYIQEGKKPTDEETSIRHLKDLLNVDEK